MKIKEKKIQLRKIIARTKKEYQQEIRSCWSSLLFDKLEKQPIFQKASIVLLYYSLPDEVQTQRFIEKWKEEKFILLPVVNGDQLELHPYQDTSSLAIGAFHILEPQTPLYTNYESIDLAIIPGVAFDREGNRLGRGKGYYDRLLPLLSNTYKIGICFKYQICKAIPHEAYDQKMNEIWTEDGKV